MNFKCESTVNYNIRVISARPRRNVCQISDFQCSSFLTDRVVNTAQGTHL